MKDGKICLFNYLIILYYSYNVKKAATFRSIMYYS